MGGYPLRREPDDAVAERLQTLNKGRCLPLVEATRQLGGELRVHPLRFPLSLWAEDLPGIEVDGSDGPAILRPSE